MSEFESFDYTKVTVAENQMSQYMDGYEHFGWKVDSNVPIEKGMGKVTTTRTKEICLCASDSLNCFSSCSSRH